MSSDTHSPPASTSNPESTEESTAEILDDSVFEGPEYHRTGNVRRDPVPDLPSEPRTGPTAQSTGKSKPAPTKAEARMIPAGPAVLSAAGGGLLLVGLAGQAGAEASGVPGALAAGGVAAVTLAAGALAIRDRRRTANRARTGADRRRFSSPGVSTAHTASASPFTRRSRAAAATEGPAVPRGSKLSGKMGDVFGRGDRAPATTTGARSAGMIPAAAKRSRFKSPDAKDRPAATGRPASPPKAARPASTAVDRGLSRFRPSARTGSAAAGPASRKFSLGGVGALRGGLGRRGSSAGGKLQPGDARAGGSAKAFKNRAANGAVGKAAKNGRDAVSRGYDGSARTRAGRVAGVVARYGSAPFKAVGAGVAGARKGGSVVGAASAARRRALKDHRTERGLGKRSRHPFRGWGSAAAAFAVYGGRGGTKMFGRMFMRMWMWNPWDAAEAAEAAAAEHERARNPQPPRRRAEARADPGGKPASAGSAPAQKKATPTPNPARPEPVRPNPKNHTPPNPGGDTMSGAPTINQLIQLSEEILRAATLRSAPGAREGLLEVLDDSKGWAIVMDNIAKAAKAETEAWHRFPVHPSIPAMYDSVNKTTSSAAAVMAGIPGTINRIERDTIDRLRNPRPNAQMLDHVNNGYSAGRG